MKDTVLQFAGKNLFNALVTLLLITVVSIHAYGWREREQLEDRVWTLEQRAAASDEAVKSLEKSLNICVEALHEKIDNRCDGIEKMINTLIEVLERKRGPVP